VTEFQSNRISIKCDSPKIECEGSLLLTSVLRNYNADLRPHDNEKCDYRNEFDEGQEITPCSFEMEAEVQCIVLNGASLNIWTIAIDSDTGCEL